MFGHNSFSWTPVQMLSFRAGTEVLDDYTGTHVYIQAHGQGVAIYNEDGSRYVNDYGNMQVFGSNASSRDEALRQAIASLPSSVFYKVKDGGHGKFKTEITVDWETACGEKNRKIADIMSHSGKIGEKCGQCIEGYEEPSLEAGIGAVIATHPNHFTACVSKNPDPNDCATSFRAKNSDNTCGDCLSGYSEDENGNCIADEEEEEGFNWGIIAGLGFIGALVVL